jgi:hypothetical protein
MNETTSPTTLSPERRRELGNSLGGRARVPKGFAVMSEERRQAALKKSLATRRRKARLRAKTA